MARYRLAGLTRTPAAKSTSPSPAGVLQGLSRADQAEVEVNKVAIYMNLAAVYIALQVGREGGSCGRARACVCALAHTA